MGFGLPSLPGLSEIKDAVVHTATDTVSEVRDLGSSAISHAADLGKQGLDLGRHAVDAVASIDVRAAADTVRGGIAKGIDAAKGGITDAVGWTSQRVHDAADFARDHVPGGDNIVSNTLRGAITVGEDVTRFQLGVVGGVTREAVGLVGTVGELGTTAIEAQLSPEAAAEYGQAIVNGTVHAAEATGNYLSSAVQDPGRIGGDIAGVTHQVGDWAGGQIDRYQQAIRDGKGPETIGMDVGTVATYVIPIGGGPARGLVEAAAGGVARTAVRDTAELVVRNGANDVVGVVGRTTEQIGTHLQQATRTELTALREAGGSNRTIGPAISTAIDTRTGQISRTFTNDVAGRLPADLNPALASRVDAARAVQYEKTAGAGSHAEVYAANELLNSGSRLEDLVVYTEQVGGKYAGGVKPPCPHCQVLLDGVTYAK